MNLIELKSNSDIQAAFGNTPVTIERQNGNLTRITLGNVAAPTLVIERAGTYSDNITVSTAERKTVFTSSTDFAGANLEKEFGSEADRDKWEKELINDHTELSFEFTRTQKIIAAE
jgi:hypothetical protein